MQTQNFDTAKAEAFESRLLGALNGGAVALMTSVGHRTGLFDVMARMEPADPHRIAAEAGLQERYVREWLGAMVTGGVVEYDADRREYRLPPEHAAILTRDARPANMAATSQWIPLLATVEEEVVACFEKGGGVPYASYGRFHAVMAEESDQTVVAVLLDTILPIVPGGIEALERGIEVLDVGCGSGRAIIEMARAFPKSRFTGYDLSPEGIGNAQQHAREAGVANASFEVRDVGTMGIAAHFDLVTAFDAIHDQAKPAAVLAAVAGALRPGGVFLMQEIGGSSHVHKDVEHPMGPFLYTVSCMHCMTVSLATGGDGLGAMWGSEMASRMLEDAGFERVEIENLEHDVINQYYVCHTAG